jgi:hypothetical protein
LREVAEYRFAVLRQYDDDVGTAYVNFFKRVVLEPADRFEIAGRRSFGTRPR